MKWQTFAKAIVGGVSGALAASLPALGHGGITSAEWVETILAGIAAFNAVYWTPNSSEKSSTTTGT